MSTASPTQPSNSNAGVVICCSLFFLALGAGGFWAYERYLKPRIEKTQVPENPSTVTGQVINETIRTNLNSVRERLHAARAGYKTKENSDKNLLGAVEELLSVSNSAREDCDAIIRACEDIEWELNTAEAAFRANATMFRQRAEGTQDEQMRQVPLRNAERQDAYASDIPRQKKLTSEFLKNIRDTRGQLAESSRTLRGQQIALKVGTNTHEPLALRVDSKMYMRQFEQFLNVVEQYYKGFGPPPPSATSAAAEKQAGG